MDFSGRPLQERFPYATLLGSTVDTCLASVYEAFWKNFTRFIREGGTPVPEVDFSPCNRREVAALVINGSGMHSTGFLVSMHLALCSRRLPTGSGRARRQRQWYLLVCWSRCTSHCVPDDCRQVTSFVQVLQFSPTVALVELTTGCCMPVVCNDRCRMVDEL